MKPRIIFCQTNEEGVLAFYKRGAGVLCPTLFEDCTFNVEVDNDIEFREAPPIRKPRVNLSPNPTTGELMMTIQENEPLEELGLYDVNGKEQAVDFIISGQEVQTSISHLPQGFYLIKLRFRSGMSTVHKIVKI